MSINQIYSGSTLLKYSDKKVEGQYVDLDGEKFYQITNYDQMPPFFMSIVSHSDSWMFISSTGGLSAGQKNEDNALFPYYTDDKITQSFETTGSKTLLLIRDSDRHNLWEPFSDRNSGSYSMSRNLYKNVLGNVILFEEINHDLNLSFKYSWSFSEEFGFIKKSWLENLGEQEREIRILDGIQNILPYGVNSALQRERSNLVNAYKKNELDREANIGLFTLSSMIIDQAVPSEALKATIAWSLGISATNYLLSSKQLANFRKGETLKTEAKVQAEPGAYFVESTLTLSVGSSTSWYIISKLSQDHSQIIEIQQRIMKNAATLSKEVEASLEKSKKELKKLVALSDGLQLTHDTLSVGRHSSSVMFNVMRGGIFINQLEVQTSDLQSFIGSRNKFFIQSQSEFFDDLGESMSYGEVLEKAWEKGDGDMIRLCYEYLPLSFSRRHGDPSRPWNKFSIEISKPDGSPNYYYEGNWRDIFQNWEALVVSFPGFIESTIVKFLNASTHDGYNPYRISRDGIDWEIIEPNDPWSYIGYWGDHQIIYLLKLLELSFDHNPAEIVNLLDKEIFVSADVPYRINKYAEVYKNPYDTIVYDSEAEDVINKRVEYVGSDGKLVHDQRSAILKSSFTEKLLITFLTKLYNFIPDAGIWLNTQRPEWNDANNALVGNGVSVVTLCYLRRFVGFCQKLLAASDHEGFRLTRPVITLLEGVLEVLKTHESYNDSGFSDDQRKLFVDAMGSVGERYRESIYQLDFDGHGEVAKNDILGLLELAQNYFDESIKNNVREDGLYHSYNIVALNDDHIGVSHLYEMLEGQVAVLSSGVLDHSSALTLLDALKNSKIYREEQYSYMLYPNRELPEFLKKNQISKERIEQSELLQILLKDKNHQIIVPDDMGGFHFNGDFNNADDLREKLHELESFPEYDELVSKDRAYLLDVFEEVFDHKSFTGRSGTFFGYEGLGSIYWHMVSKLLLAVQENIRGAREENAEEAVIGRLVEHYYEIRAGIGINKSPEVYGGFPTDPYSHTPFGKGVQQPGMTGQVKEDILNRWAELGISVRDGQITFDPFFLNKDEFLKTDEEFEYFDINQNKQSLSLSKDSLAFTYCQVPVIYKENLKQQIQVHFRNGDLQVIGSNTLDKNISSSIFNRTGEVDRVEVVIGA